MGTMDGIIDCVSAKHQLLPLLGLLKSHGKIILVGVPVEPLELPAAAVVMGEWKFFSAKLSLPLIFLGIEN